MTDKICAGYNGELILNDNGVVIKRGLKGFFLGGGFLRGDKSIPYASIVAVQLKEAHWTAGYIQLTLKGGSESKNGLFESARDENSINFYQHSNKIFLEAKEIIESKINQKISNHDNVSDEIEKLAELKNKGIITDEEFNLGKRKLLGI